MLLMRFYQLFLIAGVLNCSILQCMEKQECMSHDLRGMQIMGQTLEKQEEHLT